MCALGAAADKLGFETIVEVFKAHAAPEGSGSHCVGLEAADGAPRRARARRVSTVPGDVACRWRALLIVAAIEVKLLAAARASRKNTRLAAVAAEEFATTRDWIGTLHVERPLGMHGAGATGSKGMAAEPLGSLVLVCGLNRNSALSEYGEVLATGFNIRGRWLATECGCERRDTLAKVATDID